MSGTGDELQLAKRIQIVTEGHETDFQAQVSRALEEHYKDVDYFVDAIETTADQRALVTSNFEIIVGFLMAMALLLAFVGGLGLTATMSINVLERTREIGVMRAIGATDGAILGLVVGEGNLVGS